MLKFTIIIINSVTLISFIKFLIITIITKQVKFFIKLHIIISLNLFTFVITITFTKFITKNLLRGFVKVANIIIKFTFKLH